MSTHNKTDAVRLLRQTYDGVFADKNLNHRIQHRNVDDIYVRVLQLLDLPATVMDSSDHISDQQRARLCELRDRLSMIIFGTDAELHSTVQSLVDH